MQAPSFIPSPSWKAQPCDICTISKPVINIFFCFFPQIVDVVYILNVLQNVHKSFWNLNIGIFHVTYS